MFSYSEKDLDNLMQELFDYLNKRSPYLMIFGVILGLTSPKTAELVRPYVVEISVLMAIISMLRIDPLKLFSVFRRPLLVILTMFFVLIILPSTTFLICRTIGFSNWITTGLTFASAAPPLSSAAAFALLVRIDPAMVTGLSIPTTLMAPVSVWFLTSTLPTLGEGVELSGLIFRLSAIIIGSLSFALLFRNFIGAKRVEAWRVEIDALTAVFVTIIAIGVMHEIGLAMRSHTFNLLLIVFLAAIISYGSLGLSIAIFWLMGKEEAFAVGLLSSVKNMAIMVAAVIDVVEPMIALVVICAQLPIFFSPLVMRMIFGYFQKKG